MAMDALKNLFVQSYLVEMPHYAHSILQLGLVDQLQEIIRKAID